jgi:hypothetical protein
MTIAVGLLVPNTTDFVIAADSQETYDTAKVDGQKIMTLTVESLGREPQGCVVFTGAGRAGYLDTLGQAILKTFLDSEEGGPKLQEQFERTVRRFYRQNVFPFGEGWARNESLDLSAVIAYQRGKQHGMFANDLTAVRQTNCVAVGSGQLAVLSYLNRFRPVALSAEQAMRLAAYCVYQAKEIDPYCGKETHVVLLSGNRQQTMDIKVVEAWETVFKRIDTGTTAAQLRGLEIGIPIVSSKGAVRSDFPDSGIRPFVPARPDPATPEVLSAPTDDPTGQPPSQG